MSHVRNGDAEKLLLNGFEESQFSRLEHQKTIGDYNFFIQLKSKCWRLEIIKYGVNGIGRVEKLYSKEFKNINALLKAYKEYVIENDLEDVKHG